MTPPTIELPSRARPSLLPTHGPLRFGQRIHAWFISVGATALALAIGLAVRPSITRLDVLLTLTIYSGSILGITLGFHRLASHQAFKAPAPVRLVFWVLGSMAAQGPLIYWVSNHRRHHQSSDLPGDPHSPVLNHRGPLSRWAGFWHAHVGWTFSPSLSNPLVYAKDLYRDPVALFVNAHYLGWVLSGLALPVAAVLIVSGDLERALQAAYWSGVVRLALSFHATSAINSITHLFGSRRFATREQSRNNWLLVFPTLGEGWHNNHHAFPWSARFGLGWREPDVGWCVLWALTRLRLVSDVKQPRARDIQRMTGAIPSAEKVDDHD